MDMSERIEALHRLSPTEYPMLYQELTSRKNALLRRLEQFIAFGESCFARFPEWKERGWFPAATDKLIDAYGGSASTWQTYKNYFVLVGLLDQRRPTKKSTSGFMKESLRRAEQSHHRPVMWYRVPEYTPERLQAAEQAIQRHKAAGINRTNLTVQGAIIAHGREITKKRLVNWSSRSYSDKNAEQEIIRQIKMAVNRKGYALKDDVIRRAAQCTATREKTDLAEALCYIRNLWANRSKRLLSLAGMRYGKPTGEQKAQFRLKNSGWIITPHKNHWCITA